MRLGVALRVGVVASGLWLVGNTFHETAKTIELASQSGAFASSICEQTNRTIDRYSPKTRHEDCSAAFSKAYAPFVVGMWPNALLVSVVEIVAAWIVVLTGYGLIRWILAGRKK